jgi:hypothetical protein
MVAGWGGWVMVFVFAFVPGEGHLASQQFVEDSPELVEIGFAGVDAVVLIGLALFRRGVAGGERLAALLVASACKPPVTEFRHWPAVLTGKQQDVVRSHVLVIVVASVSVIKRFGETLDSPDGLADFELPVDVVSVLTETAVVSVLDSEPRVRVVIPPDDSRDVWVVVDGCPGLSFFEERTVVAPSKSSAVWESGSFDSDHRGRRRLWGVVYWGLESGPLQLVGVVVNVEMLILDELMKPRSKSCQRRGRHTVDVRV